MSKIKKIAVISLLTLGVVVPSSVLFAQPGQLEPQPSSASVVVLPDEQAKKEFIDDNELKNRDLQPVPSLDDTYVVQVPTNELEASRENVTIAPRRQYKALLTPNDPVYPQYYTDKISAPAAWDISTGSSAVTVAVIDTGFGLDHEDLAGRWATNDGEIGLTLTEGPAPNCTSRLMLLNKNCNNLDDDGSGLADDWRGWDFAQTDNNPDAGSTNPTGAGVSHGTATAGLTGATGNNSKGVASINWGAKILPLQLLSDDGLGYTEDLVAAINYAVARQAKVISLSIGSQGHDPLVEQAINAAVSSGVTVIAAAGNCGDSSYASQGCLAQGQILYPAKYDNVIAVGATDANDARAAFSSYGPEIDLVAPGSGAISTPIWTAGNTTTSYSSAGYGTSLSAPIVAGAAASAKGLNPELTQAQMRLLLSVQADKVGGMNGQSFSEGYGYGRLNSLKTLQFSDNPPNAPILPIYRLIRNGSHFYTGSITELVNAVSKLGFTYEGISFYASSSENPSASPVYRLNRGGNYLYTTSVTERDSAVANYGYVSEGIAFYTSTTSSDGLLPAYRLRRDNDYLLTNSTAERDSAVANYGYVSEGTGFYASTAASTNIAPVYRLYRSGKHLYTQSVDELVNAITKHNFVFEGTGFYASTTTAAGLTPIYRLHRNGSYLFTTSAIERDIAIANHSYASEGVGFYASSSAGSGLTPVYRLRNSGYLFTSSAAERDKAIMNNGYASEGIGFYAYISY